MTAKLNELARRLCEADEPVHHTRTHTVPCARHLETARRYYGLVATGDGRRDLNVLVEYVEEAEYGWPSITT